MKKIFLILSLISCFLFAKETTSDIISETQGRIRVVSGVIGGIVGGVIGGISTGGPGIAPGIAGGVISGDSLGGIIEDDLTYITGFDYTTWGKNPKNVLREEEMKKVMKELESNIYNDERVKDILTGRK